MYKRLLVSILAGFSFMGLTALPAQAQFTLLPKAPEGTDCKAILDEFEVNGVITTPADIAYSEYQKTYASYQKIAEDPQISAYLEGCKLSSSPDADCQAAQAKLDAAEKEKNEAMQKSLDEMSKKSADPLLGCAIKTGRISLQMIPFFIKYIANYLLSIVGILAVLFIVIGGYMYIYGGLTENKDRGKKYIYHALLGMAIALLSWVIVTIIIAAVTSPPT
ncbi:pilin [Patescibacteria group bacterium]|nr:pilin [Patescibacteria group bacterium]MBU1702934.1 pilin [Patescibacteria group bacterium]MBU1953476.1 pilin [Patescibacteria group bacterium]